MRATRSRHRVDGVSTTDGDHSPSTASSEQSPCPTRAISPAPRVVASRSEETATRRPVTSAIGIGRGNVRRSSRRRREPLRASDPSPRGGVHEVGATLRDTVEHRTHQVRFRRSPCDPENPPRAPKSHCGVPRPTSAGTKVTPSAEAPTRQGRGLRALSITPRSSRSHSMHAPPKGRCLRCPR